MIDARGFHTLMRLALSRRAVAKQDEADAVANPKRGDFQGIPLIIDRPKGFVQTGTAPDGTAWERTFTLDNGYIEGTLGGDGEGLDIFLGPAADAQTTHWVTQVGPDGAFDEFKAMLGFADQGEAVRGYLAHVPQEFFGGVSPVSVNTIKALLGIEPPAGIELQKALRAAQVEVRKAERAAVEAEILRLHRQHPEALRACLAEVMKAAQVEPLQELASEPYQPLVMKAGLPERVCKISALPKQQIALGVVLEPDVADAQGDTYSAKEIERSAHAYLTDFRNIGLQHKAFVNDRVKLVESYIAPVDFELNGSTIKRGTWLMAVKVLDDELWKQMQTGALSGFSIAGFATRTPIGA